MIRVLITGGSGFIGQNIQQYFLHKEDVEVFEPLVDDAITVVRKMEWRS